MRRKFDSCMLGVLLLSMSFFSQSSRVCSKEGSRSDITQVPLNLGEDKRHLQCHETLLDTAFTFIKKVSQGMHGGSEIYKEFIAKKDHRCCHGLGQEFPVYDTLTEQVDTLQSGYWKTLMKTSHGGWGCTQ